MDCHQATGVIIAKPHKDDYTNVRAYLYQSYLHSSEASRGTYYLVL